MSGLFINGQVIPVEGVTIVGPHDAAWSHLSPGDCRPRQTRWVRQWMLHKTEADFPEKMIPGPCTPDQRNSSHRTADFWANDPRHSGAHLVTGHDAVVACLADLLLTEAYHGNYACPYSIGHETDELHGGAFYDDAAKATIAVCLAGCVAMGIQLQMPKLGTYNGHPIPRYTFGGEDMVGIFGHRDTTEARGKWDPGEILFGMLAAKGVEQFDYRHGEDLDVWRDRQVDLGRKGLYHGQLDGIAGPATTAALKADGYRNGIYALGRS